jgi:hypothetical protein
MSYNALNYTEQGGEKTVIGGEIVIEGKITVADGGEVEGITGVTAAAADEGDTVEIKIGEDGKLYAPTYPTVPGEATTETAGTVRQAANVELAVGETPTKAEFDALITALINAGIMAEDEE